jgi:hypothetical protein
MATEQLDETRPRLLWYDARHRPLSEKIRYAINYYEEKYRVTATDVVVNIQQAKLEDTPFQIDGLRVHRSKLVKLDYISVGFASFEEFKEQA